MSTLTASECVAATVLAGGQSTRMGQAKALLQLDGEPLIEHRLRILKQQCADVFVTGCPAAGLYARLSVPVVDDRLADCGPLGGIATALQYLDKKIREGRTTARYLLITPCDSIALPKDFAARMLRVLESGNHELVFSKDSRRDQPLYCIMKLDALAALQGYLQRGERKVIAWMETRDYAVADFSHEGFCFDNLNTPQDWQCFVAGQR